MSDEHPDQGAKRGRRGGRRALGLGVLVGIIAGLLAYLLAPGSGLSPQVASCAGQNGAPEVRRVPPSALSGLREDVARVLPQRVARLYEEGTVVAASAWTDEEPAPPAVSTKSLRPDSYEMRWWAPNGDDVVADVFVFADAASATRYLEVASSTRCRPKASRLNASSPPLARNLSWLNPDGAAQADVYFARGPRVYRLADAPAGQRGLEVGSGSLSRAFATIDALACLLPGAHCTRVSKGVTPA